MLLSGTGMQMIPRASKAQNPMGAIAEVESETKTLGKREDTDPREETDSDEEELGRSPEP